MKKKFLLVGFLVLVIATIAFAGGKQEPAPETKEGTTSTAAEESKKLPEISIIINESPWLNAFREAVSAYVKQTGNEVEVVGVPYPSLLPKSMNAVTAPESEYDIVILDEVWCNQFYSGGLVVPMEEIDPSFKFDSEVIEYNYVTRWDTNLNTNAKSGQIYGVPINGNIQIFYYREDIFNERGLDVPQTWDELREVSSELHDPPNTVAFAPRTAGRPDFDYQAFLHSYGGYMLEYDSAKDEWIVGINSDAALEALKEYLFFVWNYSSGDYANMGQAQMISLMTAGKLMMQVNVTAAAPNFDDPNASSVVDKIKASVVPGVTATQRTPTTGIEVFSIPANLSKERQEAALTFLDWIITKKAQLIYGKAGGIVTRQDVWQELGKDPKFWWATAVADSTEYIHGQIHVTPGGRIFESVDRLLSEAIVKDISPEDMLEQAAEEIYDIMVDEGYSVRYLNE
jgi:multiple sugar transport system substrate-binding protein